MNTIIEDDKLQKQINKTRTWEDIARAVEDNSLVTFTKSIAKVSPGAGNVVSVADDNLTKIIDKNVQKRRKKLVEYLQMASPTYTFDTISEEFIIDFANLYSAVMRLRSNEKIQMMVQMFVSAHCDSDVTEKDDYDLEEYDEMLEKINRLSLREIKLLYLLHKHGTTSNEFYSESKEALGISTELINNMLLSITQTGFCKEKVGMYLGYTGNQYYTTELYSRFLKMIHVEDGISDDEKKVRLQNQQEEVFSEEPITKEDIEAL